MPQRLADILENSEAIEAPSSLSLAVTAAHASSGPASAAGATATLDAMGSSTVTARNFMW